ncbi:hypothetical protein BGHDH14_bgh03974 [Blumeria hordei DH14]|uniref:STEEP1 domain-containing protein n=1 Tax=Blumeria graminis f. sp. hordei (strain DH14) TaxID=546991 RepID=N1JEL5_BLUG1|nr:hypothetical protein BGHDH14_bgh03974 [Blumeria hordei DH14]
MSVQIHTYHCLCTALVLASSHSLSTLPRRSLDNDAIDTAIILPLPDITPMPNEPDQNLPQEGYSLLIGVDKDSDSIDIRRLQGVERRFLYRCSKCQMVIGYEIVQGRDVDMIDDNDNDGSNMGTQPIYYGKILYILPGGLMTTEVMVGTTKITVAQVQIGPTVAAALE